MVNVSLHNKQTLKTLKGSVTFPCKGTAFIDHVDVYIMHTCTFRLLGGGGTLLKINKLGLIVLATVSVIMGFSKFATCASVGVGWMD